MLAFSRSLQYVSRRLVWIRSAGQCNSVIHTKSMSMKDDVDSDITINLEASLKELDLIDGNWLRKQEGQRHITSIMHSLLEKRMFPELQKLIGCIRSSDYEPWSGMATLILQTFIELKQLDEAVKQYEVMKGSGQIKHTRTLKKLIKGLVGDNKMNLAYDYFRQLIDIESVINTSRLKEPDMELVDDIMTKILNNQLAIQSKSNGNINTEERVGLLVGAILKYIESWEVQPSDDFTERLIKWFRFQENYVITMAGSSKSSKCTICSKSLSWDNFDHICDVVVSSFETNHSDKYADVKFLQDIMSKNGAFDIIIDAGNILFQDSTKDKKIKKVKYLKEILVNIDKFSSKSFFNIAIVFPQSMSKREKLHEFSFINELARKNAFNYNLNVITLKRMHDDFVICYLAAKSEIQLRKRKQLPVVVSNDNFHDHRFMVDSEFHYDFLRWLRHRKVRSNGNKYVQLSIKPIVIDNKNVHLLLNNGNVVCVQDDNGTTSQTKNE